MSRKTVEARLMEMTEDLLALVGAFNAGGQLCEAAEIQAIAVLVDKFEKENTLERAIWPPQSIAAGGLKWYPKDAEFEGTNEVHHPSEVDDAARYRWLRQHWSALATQIDMTGEENRRVERVEVLTCGYRVDPVSLDSAIDEARKA